MRYLLPLLCLALSACVTQTFDRDGNPIGKDRLERDLVVDDNGRIIGRPTRLTPPHTIIINGGTPTEREVRLLGVEGLSRRAAPNTFAMAREWMADYMARQDEIFIKPTVGTDLKQRVIYGHVFLYAVDPETGTMLPNRYVSVNQAMLSQGLVRIRDIREFETVWRPHMQEAENHARREKLGLWSDQP